MRRSAGAALPGFALAGGFFAAASFNVAADFGRAAAGFFNVLPPDTRGLLRALTFGGMLMARGPAARTSSSSLLLRMPASAVIIREILVITSG